VKLCVIGPAAKQWFVGAFRYGYVSGSAQFEQTEVVRAHLVHRDVSARRGDADQIGVGTGQ
jgi:hypothetical protein